MSASSQTPALESGQKSADHAKVRQRGPVEEVIAKRMRQIGKKLQRIKGYASISPEQLNPDQKNALTTLPALEGAYRELEDLIKEKGPVDEQELIQAAKLREAHETAKAQADEAIAVQVQVFKSSVAKSLSLFLQLHSLLHPARPTDTEHLTFGPLSLPPSLQDEVLATDILRVGRMWEDLREGEESAQKVLEGLAAGPTGEDEENDHIHRLLQLLSGDTGTQDTDASAYPTENTVEPTDSTNVPIIESEMTTAPPSVTFDPSTEANGPLDTEVAETEPSAQSSGGMINFLQEDELDAGDVGGVDAATEHSFEVVPMLEPHQTSGLQPPLEEPVITHPAPESSSQRTKPQATPQLSPGPTGNWADEDVEDAAAPVTPTEIPADASVVTTQNSTQLVGLGIEQPAAAQSASASAAVVPEVVAASSSSPRSAKQNKSSSSQSSSRQPKNKQNRSGQKQKQTDDRQAQAKDVHRRTTVVDEDGFEMKVRRAPQAPIAGRGGRGGGPGSRGRGEGRGGAGGNRGGRGVSQGSKRGVTNGVKASGPAKDGNAARGPSTGQDGAAGRKASIYKAVQPDGPKSAPVIS